MDCSDLMEVVSLLLLVKFVDLLGGFFFFFLGKSTILAVLGNREVPIPEHIDIFYLSREMPASDKTALQCVMEVDEERVRLEKLAEELVACEDDGKKLFFSNFVEIILFFVCF